MVDREELIKYRFYGSDNFVLFRIIYQQLVYNNRKMNRKFQGEMRIEFTNTILNLLVNTLLCTYFSFYRFISPLQKETIELYYST